MIAILLMQSIIDTYLVKMEKISHQKNKKEKEYNFLETDTAFVQIKAKTEIINDDDIIHIHKEFKDH